MDKTFLLLRENRESGPYTLDELLLKQLNERDLVWIEGESITWTKPASIESLELHIRKSNQASPGSYETRPFLVNERPVKRKKTLNKYLVVLAILAGSFSGWMLAKSFHEQDNLHVAAASNLVQPEKSEVYISSTTNEHGSINSIDDFKEEVTSKKQPTIIPAPEPEPTTLIPQDENEIKPVVEDTAANENYTQNTEEQTSTEKKNIFKKLGDWLKGGKELDEEKKNEGRQVNIKESVSVSVSTGDNTWMMGIKGQQMKVFNRSNASLQFGKVELLYYSEQNAVLDKKIVDIPSIEAGKSKSIAIPDHKLADRVEAIVVDAVGIE